MTDQPLTRAELTEVLKRHRRNRNRRGNNFDDDRAALLTTLHAALDMLESAPKPVGILIETSYAQWWRGPRARLLALLPAFTKDTDHE